MSCGLVNQVGAGSPPSWVSRAAISKDPIDTNTARLMQVHVRTYAHAHVQPHVSLVVLVLVKAEKPHLSHYTKAVEATLQNHGRPRLSE